ncbi:MAG: RNA polymerase subunit sigma-70 [Alphaproteobacteria bacterium]|nr:RNA polymerase subunit sigma-70 [Alphaproteobacteria bacterium]
MTDARESVELAARASYGRLLAWLTSRCGSIELAEDALGNALAEALTRWPEAGVPRNPEAWLLTVARRRLVDETRRRVRHEDQEDRLKHEAQLRLHVEAAEASEVPLRDGLPERRLELMFLCAHPDIPSAMRTPLMLQTVLGLNAQQIGSAMLVAPSTMGQRLVRVKRRIVEQGIPFEVPGSEALPERAGYVLDAIYAAYGAGWDSAPELGGGEHGLAGEAIWLAGLLVRLLPELAEAKGLYALLCHCEARRPARRTPEGAFVPLEAQDTALWDPALRMEGERALWLAAQQRQMGRYQNEAAIHSHHAHRARTGTTDWRAIHGAYRALVGRFPTQGAQIGYAASFGRLGDPEAGLAVLDGLDPDTCARHQPYWAVRSWLLGQAGRLAEADAAYARAIGLCTDPAVRAWLTGQRQALRGTPPPRCR